jgi:hypothetical protein
MQKLTKEQMLSELMIKLETIDGKLDKLLGNQELINNISINTDGVDVEAFIKAWNDATGRTRWMTNQEFDEEMK